MKLAPNIFASLNQSRSNVKKIEINLAYFSLLNNNKTHHRQHHINTHQMIRNVNLKIDVFKMTQIPGGSFIGRKSSQFSFVVINSERKTWYSW